MPPSERQQSIDAEEKAALRRINTALRALSEQAGVEHANVPTQAVNAADLLKLQQLQHIANALEAVTAGPQVRSAASDSGVLEASRAAADQAIEGYQGGTDWNEGNIPSFAEPTRASRRKGS